MEYPEFQHMKPLEMEYYLHELQNALEDSELFRVIIERTGLEQVAEDAVAKVVLDEIVFGLGSDWQVKYHCCCDKCDDVYEGIFATNRKNLEDCKVISIYKRPNELKMEE